MVSKRMLEYGLLFAILSPIFSSIATVFQAGATKTLSPLIVSSVGALLGSAILTAILLFTKERRLIGRAKKNAKDIAAMTLLRPIIGVTMLAVGLSMTTAVKAIFFTKIEPYFVLGLHWLIEKERIYPRQLVLLAVHVAAVILLSMGGTFAFGTAQMGDLLVIISMGFLAASYLFGAKLSRSIGARAANAITMGIGGLVLLPFAIGLSPAIAWTSAIGWNYLIGYVIIFNVIGLTLWFAALKTVKGWIVSALRAIGPLAGMPVAFLLFGETLTSIQLAAGAIVLITSALIAREHKVHKRR